MSGKLLLDLRLVQEWAKNCGISQIVGSIRIRLYKIKTKLNQYITFICNKRSWLQREQNTSAVLLLLKQIWKDQTLFHVISILCQPKQGKNKKKYFGLQTNFLGSFGGCYHFKLTNQCFKLNNQCFKVTNERFKLLTSALNWMTSTLNWLTKGFKLTNQCFKVTK